MESSDNNQSSKYVICLNGNKLVGEINLLYSRFDS